MKRQMIKRLLAAILILAVIGISIWIYEDYGRDIGAAQERVQAGSHVIETAYGPIEYAEIGDGPPVLIAHAAGGGFDQGMLFARILGGNFRYIIPSRFGYLQSSLPSNATVQMQADAYACLLDTLHVKQVAVLGVSAGGPSSMQFALRYPGRVRALVMASAVSCNDAPPRSKLQELPFRLIESDFLFWGLTTAFHSQMLSFFGLSKDVQADLTPGQMERASQVINTMLPMSKRIKGMRFDMDNNYSGLEKYPIERITAPTLVVHAKDDYFVRYSHGKYTADKIPGARLVTLKSGGHLVVAINEKAQSEIVAFLKQYASTY